MGGWLGLAKAPHDPHPPIPGPFSGATPLPPNRWPNSADFADLFCQFMGFL